MFELKGKIEFDPINVTKKHNNQSSWKKTAMVKFDDDTFAYYSWFLQKRFNLFLNKPLRGTHVTIINDKCDDEIYAQARQLFHGKEITLQYDLNNFTFDEFTMDILLYNRGNKRRILLAL